MYVSVRGRVSVSKSKSVSESGLSSIYLSECTWCEVRKCWGTGCFFVKSRAKEYKCCTYGFESAHVQVEVTLTDHSPSLWSPKKWRDNMVRWVKPGQYNAPLVNSCWVLLCFVQGVMTTSLFPFLLLFLSPAVDSSCSLPLSCDFWCLVVCCLLSVCVKKMCHKCCFSSVVE